MVEPAAGVARQAQPALGAEQVHELVTRFTGEFMPNLDGHRFDPDGFVRKMDTHLEVTGLRPHGGREDEPGLTEVVVEHVMEQRPAVDHVYYFVNPADHTLGWSVFTPALRDEMLERGYTQLHMTHLSRDHRLLPPAVVAPTPPEGDPAAPPEGAPQRSTVKVPTVNPKIKRGKRDDSAAKQIVDWFEQQVQIDGQTYSPMYRWSKRARMDACFGHSNSSVAQEFWKRCLIYIYIREALNDPPGSITLSYSDLREIALNNNNIAGAPGEGGGDAWDRAKTIAKRMIRE